jgi:HlyD family secretion protein
VKWRRIIMWGALAVAVVAGIVFALMPRPVPVDLGVVATGDLMVTVDEEGETRVREVFALSAPVTGRVLRIEADVGDSVVGGETELASIEPIDPAFLDVRGETQARAGIEAAKAARALAEAKLDEANAELDFARAELDRARKLIGKRAISQRHHDAAERTFRTRKAAVDTARAGLRMREFQLEQARAELVSPAERARRDGDCECITIRAPVSGRILRILRESEGVVRAGQPLLEIGDPADLEIVIDLLSSDAVRVSPGDRVIIEAWGGAAPLRGWVRRVEPYGFTKVSALGIEEQRVNVIVDFESPPEDRRSLGHGYRVEARIVLWEGRDVLTVPLGALFRDGEHWAVFVAVDGLAEKRHVSLGRRNTRAAEVTDGLRPGDRPILHPSERIAPGTPVIAR